MEYRINKSGHRHLSDLRKALSLDWTTRIEEVKGKWSIYHHCITYSSWIEQQCHPLADERQALEQALRLEPTTFTL